LDLPLWQFDLQEDDASFCPDAFVSFGHWICQILFDLLTQLGFMVAVLAI
jgi:hypothetical protein